MRRLAVTSPARRSCSRPAPAVLLGLALALAGCAEGEVEELRVVSTGKPLACAAGDRILVDVAAVVKDRGPLRPDEVAWTVSNPTVFGFEDGAVVARSSGTAKLSARAGKAADDLTVKVTIPTHVVVLPERIPALVAGRTAELTASVTDELGRGAGACGVRWGTDDERVATVVDGQLTAVAAGRATVWARSGTAEGRAEVHVIPAPVLQVLVSPATTALKPGQKVRLEARAFDASGRRLDVSPTWVTSDANVVQVDQAGFVVAGMPGDTVVTALVGTRRGGSRIVVRPDAK